MRSEIRRRCGMDDVVEFVIDVIIEIIDFIFDIAKGKRTQKR